MGSFDKEQGKALITSKSFWGVVVASVAVFVPKYATQLDGVVDDIAIAGLVFAIIGRFAATEPITGVLKK